MKTHVRFLPTEHPALCRAIALVDTFPRSQAAKLTSGMIRLGLDLMVGRNATVAPALQAHIRSLNEIATNPVRDVRRVSIEMDAQILDALHALGAESARAQQALLRASAVMATRLLLAEKAPCHTENAISQTPEPEQPALKVGDKESPASAPKQTEPSNDEMPTPPNVPVQTTHQQVGASDTGDIDPMAIFAQFVSNERGCA